LLLWVRRAGDIDRLQQQARSACTAARRSAANASSVMFAATQQTEHRLVVFVLKLMGEEEKGEKDIAISSIDRKQAIDVHTIRAGGYYHRSS